MKRRRGRSITELMEDSALIEAAIRRGAREALIRHKKAGVPIAAWEDGKVVVIPARKIKIPPVVETPRARKRKSR